MFRNPWGDNAWPLVTRASCSSRLLRVDASKPSATPPPYSDATGASSSTHKQWQFWTFVLTSGTVCSKTSDEAWSIFLVVLGGKHREQTKWQVCYWSSTWVGKGMADRVMAENDWQTMSVEMAGLGRTGSGRNSYILRSLSVSFFRYLVKALLGYFGSRPLHSCRFPKSTLQSVIRRPTFSKMYFTLVQSKKN